MNKELSKKSIEPQVADYVNRYLHSINVDYKLEQESLNKEIDDALLEYASKGGGKGGNRPDCKLIIENKNGKRFPVLIEYKGYKDKLVKLDKNNNVDNTNEKNEPNYKNIKDYAVNGAVHYANAILHYTQYKKVIAIGITGYIDDFGKGQYLYGVYLVSSENLGAGQKIADYTDLSFLDKKNQDEFFETISNLSLSDKELQAIKDKRDNEISINLTKLNNDIYKSESGISESDRVYLVVASIIANLGTDNVKPLTKDDLTSSNERNERDGDKIFYKVSNFLSAKELPESKQYLIERALENVLKNDIINKVVNGETQIKRIFCKVVDDLGIYYKIGLNTDFTGKLFNEMYSWLGFTQDKLNDVVLTPSYIATLLVRLARVNKDSYVWDFATGSAGLLVAAMNEMLKDAKSQIASPNELREKEFNIKLNQLLGIEILPNIYMLAILNMILMGDGSSNIINEDSLVTFDGNYAYRENKEKFPATAFVLNPPYSAAGNGMIFVERALSMMDKGYAAIIIQNSAGSGKAIEYNKSILKHSTLLASIKMPIDIFIGKSSVQTNVYVFKVGEAHKKDDTVKFIDFSNDGYTRANRKKANASVNLRDTDHAKERYNELVDLVLYGKKKLKYFTEKEYYESEIDPENGADWNKTAPVDTRPTLTDFKKTVSDYLAFEVSNILKKKGADESLGK